MFRMYGVVVRRTTLCAIALLSACAGDFDSERVAPQRASIGEELYRVFCERMASEALPRDVTGSQTRALCAGRAGPESAPEGRLRAFAERREVVVNTLNAVFPEAEGDDFVLLLRRFLPLYEPPEEVLPSQTRSLGQLLGSLREDAPGLEALQRVSAQEGYRPAALGLGMLKTLLVYPRLPEVTARLRATIEPGGIAEDEWDDLQRAVAAEMASASERDPNDADSVSTLSLVRDLLWQERSEWAGTQSLSLPIRDSRGIAVPRRVGDSVVAPFVDADADGLADVDALDRLVTTTGEPPPSPFAVAGDQTARDAEGRAIGADGMPLYAYQQVSQSLLAGLLRNSQSLFEGRDATEAEGLSLAKGLSLFLGPPADQSATRGQTTLTYRGYDTDGGPWFDLIHAAGSVAHEAATDDVLSALHTLLTQNDPTLAGLVESVRFGNQRGDAEPDVQLPDDSEFWDDLIQIGTWIAQEPGLMEALLRAFADPRTARLGPMLGELMRHRDTFAFDADLNRPLRTITFVDEVDRGTADDAGNESIFQRLASIIHDFDGTRWCNKADARVRIRLPIIGTITVPFANFGECDLIEIEDMSQTYALSMVGRARIDIKSGFLNGILAVTSIFGLNADSLIQGQSGIDGLTTSPTPEALNRLIFSERNNFLTSVMDPPRTRDGALAEQRHDPVLLAWERAYQFCGDEIQDPGAPCDRPEVLTFYQALSPIIDAFDRFDRRTEGRFLFNRFISRLHLHWPSPANPRTQSMNPQAAFYATHDDVRSFEPIVSDLFSDCAWMPTETARVCEAGASGKLFRRLHEIAVRLQSIPVRPGVNGLQAVAGLAESWFNPALHPELTTRSGSRTTRTNAGSREPEVAPLYLMVDAFSAMGRALDASGDAQTRWDAALTQLGSTWLTTTPIESTSQVQFVNDAFPPMAGALVTFARDRIAVHRDAGDLGIWSESLDDRAVDAFGGPLGATVISFLAAVEEDPDARAELSQFIAHLLDEDAQPEAYASALLAAADLLQQLDTDRNRVPLMRALSEGVTVGVRRAVEDGEPAMLDRNALPDGVLGETLQLLGEAQKQDDNRTLSGILRRLATNPASSASDGDDVIESRLETLLDVIGEVNRARPGETSSLQSADYQEVFRQMAEFFLSEERGMERLYQVIQHRRIE